ncbi:HAMP domain-containing sensor histidine kinase [Dyella sp. BiH032]|uniref:sensor histidine kinase n=1 Tax=Dyella sp. BiH032 TaxID=3075430 RepID=UPI0028931E3D|nr:HAMP domain-containing sensor histidine kinase [Dyella sp. BiH032]WNL47081.1 HAMP domain-containing sensor histidine kinase [Dyella sp. BiH032]
MAQSEPLLRRLLLDAVLPSTLAALLLVTALTVQVAGMQAERTDARAALRIEQLAGALAASPSQGAIQGFLDESRRDGLLRYVALRYPSGPEWSSGNAHSEQDTGNYRRELPGIVGNHPWVIAQADLGPVRRAQSVTWLLGVLCASGVLLLGWLARWSLRRHVLRPLGDMRRALDQGRLLPLGLTASTREFAELERALEHCLAEGWPRTWRTARQDVMRQRHAAARGKSRFIALVNHHLRQPLQALQLFAANFNPGPDPDQQALLAHMRASVSSMTRLLEALLEISRLDAGVVAVRPTEFSAAELFLHDRPWLMDEASRRGVTLAWHGSHHRLHGDAELAAGLLLQLASNAIANAPMGRVLIAARRRGHAIRIEVRDNGPGIPEDRQEHIFEEFVQLPASENPRRDGYGLGLTIGDRLARLLGTHIGLRSAPGRGSTFWFDLPEPPIAERHAPQGRHRPWTTWRRAG